MSNQEKEAKFCRICMDGEGSGKLISPCRCSGSLSHIHEECLKTWLASKNSEMEDSQCEICHTKLLMKFIVRRKCSSQQAFNEGITHCLFLPLLLAVMSILGFIIYILSDKLAHDPGNAQEQGYAIGLIVTCSLSLLTIIILIVSAFQEACVSSQLEEWRIFDQEFSDPIFEEKVPEYTVREVPDFIRIRGRRVRTIVGTQNRIIDTHECHSALLQSNTNTDNGA